MRALKFFRRTILRQLLASCGIVAIYASAKAQEMPPALVVTEPVQRVEFHDQLTLIGRSAAKSESRIVAEISGRVLSVDAREGRWLANGKTLVSIDPRRIQLSLEAKDAEAKQALADAELAQKELDRVENLFKQEILPERTLDDVRATATRTIERYHQLEAERKRLELDVESCTIRSPYAGFTIRQLVQVGEWVSPGTPVYEMVDLSVAKVTVDLPERHFGEVEMGSAVAITISGDDANPIIGRLSGIARQASEATHTFPIIVSVNNREGRLGSGMLVRATISLKNKFSSLAVSKDAIVRQGSQTIVYTIIDGKAAPVPVRLSSRNGTMVAVQGDGLESGMPVVVRGNERIFPGSPVQTPSDGQEAESPAGQTTPGSR